MRLRGGFDLCGLRQWISKEPDQTNNLNIEATLSQPQELWVQHCMLTLVEVLPFRLLFENTDCTCGSTVSLALTSASK